MEFSVESTSPTKKKTDLVCCFVDEDKLRVIGFPRTSDLLQKEIDQEVKNIKGKFCKTSVISTLGQITPKKLLLVGIGKIEKINQDTFRFAAGRIAKKAEELKILECSIVLPKGIVNTESIESQIIEGLILSTYSFDKYKNKKEKMLNKISLILENKKNVQDVKKSQIIANAVNYSRDIANLPPNDCSPSTLALIAKKLATKNGMAYKIISGNELKNRGFGGIYAVGKGSRNEPKLIILEHNHHDRKKKPVVIVGKAVTFDTGGISLKPGEKMDEMKFDKCGGCTVLGIMKAVSELKLPVRVVGIIPSVENMPSGESFRPGDIIKLYNGKTAEILNTDAEGRLILADALSYGEKTYNPSKIFDFATLTGACIIALGANVAGMISNDQRLTESIKQSASNTAESIWQLPLNDDYLDMIKSDVADIKNVGLGRTAGAIVAAAFLSKAIEKTPWIHFDIAGVAWTQFGTKEKPYNPKGATGFGIRLLLEYLSKS